MGKKEIHWCESDKGLDKVKSKERRKKKMWGKSFITHPLEPRSKYLLVYTTLMNVFTRYSQITIHIF